MSPRQLFEEPARLFQDLASGRRGPFMVRGGPGSGKTRLVVDLACHWAPQPGTVTVVLTSNRAAADRLRAQIHGRLLRASPQLALAKPLVRTTHSYAFALLEARARASGNPPPRLIPAAEQDATLRELAIDQAARWPEPLRAALGSMEFTAQLRSVFQRAAQHGHGPEGLIALGTARARPEWVAAGRTWREYEQVMTLRGAVGMADPAASPGALDAAELLGAALDAVAEDPDLLLHPLGKPGSRFVVFVDDAQHFDPQAARLSSLAARRADLAVCTVDPDQSVFWFQGAQTGPGLWREAEQLRLGPSQRLSSSVAQLVAAVAPRSAPQVATCRESAGEAQTRLYPTVAAQAEGVVEALCRAHARDQVPWSRMAVLVRSVPVLEPSLARAAALADVPLRLAAMSGPLAANTAVSALLSLLKALARKALEPATALELLVSPIAGASVAQARSLRRLLRAQEPDRPSLDLLAELVLGAREHDVPEPVLRLRRVWRAACEALGAPAPTVETVLWAAWSASGLEERLPEGDFAAVRALFAAARAQRAADAADAAAELARFAERVERERLPVSATLGDGGGSDAVTLLSAHAAAGQEWDVVVVCGVQEGLWPGFSESSSLLGVDELAAALAGTPAEAKLDARKQVLAQERRLLYLACSRAREQLLVTAVEGEGDLVPSRFLAPLAPLALRTQEHGPAERAAAAPPPAPATPWSSAGVVAELRALACGADQHRAQRAAAALAALAQAGVIGAHPKSWHGLAEVSTSEPLAKDGSLTLSPSRVQQLLDCPLRWLFERAMPAAPGEAAAIGTAVHLLASVADRFPEDELQAALDAAARAADERSARPPWAAQRRREQLARLFAAFMAWRNASRGELTQVGVEIPVEMSVSGVTLRGRIDRLERTARGELVIVDLKTAATPRSAASVREDPQLACYQLVVRMARDEPVAGGKLVYLGALRQETGAAEREQPALTEEEAAQWNSTIREAAAAAAGPQFRARPNQHCGSCPGRRCCPALQSAPGAPLAGAAGGAR
ncbi:ATP-dependent DNA helicase [Segniliparus rotundus]|nr:ATP-dependent DNA helicase [Segniliparus rotundus]